MRSTASQIKLKRLFRPSCHPSYLAPALHNLASKARRITLTLRIAGRTESVLAFSTLYSIALSDILAFAFLAMRSWHHAGHSWPSKYISRAPSRVLNNPAGVTLLDSTFTFTWQRWEGAEKACIRRSALCVKLRKVEDEAFFSQVY